MPPIKIQHTGTSDGAWDGPANEARLKNDGDQAYYRKMYAWQDPEGDSTTKGAYKFPHHEVDGDANIGDANIKACQSAIAVLNGGMGGADIPDGDRQGVYDHLAGHLKDAEVEPPELRSQPWAPKGPEMRFFPLQEIRTTGTGSGADPRRIEGYAAVFNILSPPLWGFRERINPGAFTKAIQESDVRALWNHDSNFVFGRNKAGTLKLMEDDHGLGFTAFPPDTTWARDFMVSIERGDVDQASFQFEAVLEEWSTVDGEIVRDVREVKLYDVSPVTFPAYPTTNVDLRSVFGQSVEELAVALAHLEAGAMSEEDKRRLAPLVESIRGRFTSGPVESDHPEDDDESDGEAAQERTSLARRKVELAKVKLLEEA